MSEVSKERRKHTRYQLPRNEVFAYSPELKMSATITDISLGGLKIEYFPAVKNTANRATIDIRGGHPRRFYMSGIACKIVYDIKHLSENRTFSGTRCRVCGLKYELLSKRQKIILQMLLENFDG
jgi:hypothetical protein